MASSCSGAGECSYNRMMSRRTVSAGESSSAAAACQVIRQSLFAEEIADTAPSLGDAVGVDEERVVRFELTFAHLGRRSAQPQRQPRPRLDRPDDLAAAQQQRQWMARRHESQPAARDVELTEHRSHEPALAELIDEDRVDRFGGLGEVGTCAGSCPVHR